MSGRGLANGIAELDSTAKVPAVQIQNVEELNTGINQGEGLYGDGAGGFTEQVVIGSYYFAVEDNTQKTSASGTPVLQVQLDTNSGPGNVPAGNYKISWHYVWETVSGETIETVVHTVAPGVGPNAVLNNPGGIGYSVHEGFTDDENEVSGWRIQALNAGRQVVKIEFNRGVGAGTVRMWRGAIELKRVP